jgi:hypothetical protein
VASSVAAAAPERLNGPEVRANNFRKLDLDQLVVSGMATKRLARYARGFQEGGCFWSGAGDRGKARQLTSAAKASILPSFGVSHLHSPNAVGRPRLSLGLEPQAAFYPGFFSSWPCVSVCPF